MSAGTKQSLVDYSSQVWSYRHFWLSLVSVDLRTRYRRSVLGIGWSLLHPIAMTGVICVVWTHLFGMNLREAMPVILTGFTFWAFVTGCVVGGCNSFSISEPFIRQIHLPLAIYPLRTMLGAAFQFFMALIVVLVMTWALVGFANLQVVWFIVPALLTLLIIGWAVATVMAVMHSFFPDTVHLSEVLLQVLFYATPIIYPAELLRKRGLGWLININPLSSLLELVRVPIVHGTLPEMTAMLTAAATAIVLLTLAVIVLSRYERQIIFHL